MTRPRPLTIGLHPALERWAPEVKYVFRTLARTAGLPYAFVRHAGGAGAEPADLWYGPARDAPAEPLVITWSGRPFDRRAGDHDPVAVDRTGPVPWLRFAGDPARAPSGTSLGDVVYSCFWLLSGAREQRYPRDRRDNLQVAGGFWARERLGAQPMVSLTSAFLRRHFHTHHPASPPWLTGGATMAFALTHDVDYPEIFRLVEGVRLLRSRGRRALPLVGRVLRGASHFWQFRTWLDLGAELDVRPAFYFMARRGSLIRYAMGTPDAFYDIRAPRFQRLFDTLREAGAEIGLHAAYHAHRSAERLLEERESLAAAAGAEVVGNRHHYWHLDPDAPDETLRRAESAGFRYDSSLAFESHPGFRRGICHPFRPYHLDERRELKTVEVPPAWMDDHFGRRRTRNGVTSPDAAADELLDAARSVGGVVVVDYHVRGMNPDFFPEYGPWLAAFARRRLTSDVARRAPRDLAAEYVAYERDLDRASRDDTGAGPILIDRDDPVVIGSMRAEDVPAVARMHYEFFALGDLHGHSVAKLGPEFLADVFYGPNVGNPHFYVDVARHGHEVVGFSVYVTDRHRVFRHTLRRHPARLAASALRQVLRRPRAVLHLLGNLRYVGGERLPWLEPGDAHWLLFAIQPEYRSSEFERRAGTWVAGEMFRRMEARMAARGCAAWYAAPGIHNPPINRFMARCGATHVGTATAQGLSVNYWRRVLDEAGNGGAEPLR